MTVPLWLHILVIGCLLGTLMFTTFAMRQRIRGLEDALHMRAVLLGEDRRHTASIMPGGTMVLTVKSHVERIRIWSRYEAKLQIVFEDDR